MEGTCHYCGSGTSLLEILSKKGVGDIKVCPECKAEYHGTGDDEEPGLYDKYEVYKDGEKQDNCFVLKPESDEAAVAALSEYANRTDNDLLAAELRRWIEAIDSRSQQRSVGTDSDLD